MLENSSYIVERNTLFQATINDDKIIKIEMNDQLNKAIDMIITYSGQIITESVSSLAQKIFNDSQ